MRELFIYWRASAQEADAAHQAARAWQRQLREAYPHLLATLYRRDENVAQGQEVAAPVTFMEVYAAQAPGSTTGLATGPDVGLDAALEQHLVTEGNAVLGPWLQSARKVEAFVRSSAA